MQFLTKFVQDPKKDKRQKGCEEVERKKYKNCISIVKMDKNLLILSITLGH